MQPPSPPSLSELHGLGMTECEACRWWWARVAAGGSSCKRWDRHPALVWGLWTKHFTAALPPPPPGALPDGAITKRVGGATEISESRAILFFTEHPLHHRTKKRRGPLGSSAKKGLLPHTRWSAEDGLAVPQTRARPMRGPVQRMAPCAPGLWGEGAQRCMAPATPTHQRGLGGWFRGQKRL